MTDYATAEVEGTDTLDERDVRALTECMTVSPDIGQARNTEDFVVVTTESGHSYTVDLRHGMCGCPDAEHRDPEGGCKHVRRAEFATGRRPLPAWISLDAVDDQLGACCDGPVATDGGEILVAGDEGEILDDGDDQEDEHDEVRVATGEADWVDEQFLTSGRFDY
jgi:hypothetical protein